MQDIAARLWSSLAGDPAALARLEMVGERRVLPSVFDVTGVATAAVGVASLAAAELEAARSGGDMEPVSVTTRESSAAFWSEALFSPQGWERPPAWDPIARDYRGADGWIRLHTNYSHHRAAALRALGLDRGDRDTVAARVESWAVDDLEARVVAEGGAAAAMHTREEWLAHPHGSMSALTPPVEITPGRAGSRGPLPPGTGPLGGVRILDLTRVIAGPFATRFLAAWGAEVLRLDPPGFEEVLAIVPESTAGKRCGFLDLANPAGRERFLDLVRQADVVVHGYRPGAMGALGLDQETLREANPDLIISHHDAYGWDGPWAGRRGFDSLVQMSSGIAAARGTDRPRPLPVQALDHTVGMLVASAVCRALTIRVREGTVSDIRASLIGAANLLYESPDPGAISIDGPSFTIEDTERRATWWGPARAVPIPGYIGDRRPHLVIEPGPLGRHEPAFAS
ncbi:MAG: CoA transferase [Acidimicrobiales bacterium]|nr:CoA transferase [Acidimicrobiales bacterium]